MEEEVEYPSQENLFTRTKSENPFSDGKSASDGMEM